MILEGIETMNNISSLGHLPPKVTVFVLRGKSSRLLCVRSERQKDTIYLIRSKVNAFQKEMEKYIFFLFL